MDYYLQFSLLLLLLGLSAIVNPDTDLQDYCVEDGFQASCPAGEILLMQDAFYGRMEFGTCLKYAVGMNCQSDVLEFMDTWCSGQRTCQVNIFDIAQLTNDCPRELLGYLQARYICLEVVSIGDQCCHSPDERKVLPISNESIASSVIRDTECVGTTCPLVIQALSGQHINISIYNFNITSVDLQHSPHTGRNLKNSRCFVHVNIKEAGIGITVELCIDDVRKRHVYTTSTNEIEIRVVTDDGRDASRFMFYFEVIGCPDPIPPENGYVDYEGQQVFVRCTELNDVVWEIICRQNNWQGEIGNCTNALPDTRETDIGTGTGLHFNRVAVIAVIITLAVVIAAGIILIGFACIKPHRVNQGAPLRNRPGSDTQSYTYGKPLPSSHTAEGRYYKDQPPEISYPQPYFQPHGSRNDLPNDVGNRSCDMSTFGSSIKKKYMNQDSA